MKTSLKLAGIWFFFFLPKIHSFINHSFFLVHRAGTVFRPSPPLEGFTKLRFLTRGVLVVVVVLALVVVVKVFQLYLLLV